MESIDELRREVCRNGSDRTVRLVADHIDKIEQEIEERYIELPKDVDGIPVHVNDEMESVYNPDRVFIVKRLKYSEKHGWMIGGAIRDDLSEYNLYDCRNCHHYKPPTVEDVLREFTDAILEWAGESGAVAEVGTWSDVAADFVKRLQLREEE